MNSDPSRGSSNKKRSWMPSGDQVLKTSGVIAALTSSAWYTISVIQWLLG